MISVETIKEMGRVYREIESGEKLLAQIDEELKKEKELPDFYGNMKTNARKCQLGWPGITDNSSFRIFQVEPRIARSVVVAHLADQRAMLVKLNELARLEILEIPEPMPRPICEHCRSFKRAPGATVCSLSGKTVSFMGYCEHWEKEENATPLAGS